MPHVTVNNRRMTNVQLTGGDVIQVMKRIYIGGQVIVDLLTS
jgi:hypothetical protein